MHLTDTKQTVNLLVCDCGDCRHWEILHDSIICMSCGHEFQTPGVGAALDAHVDVHPKLSWKDHER